MEWIKQNKGKPLEKVPRSKLNNGPYYISTKYDGHYVQIQYDGEEVAFATSDHKPFYLENVANYIKDNFIEPFYVECEYLYDCEGKLGDRGKSAKLTTYRTNYNKGIRSFAKPHKDKFIILDRLDMPGEKFSSRLNWIINNFMPHHNTWFDIPIHQVGVIKDGVDLGKQFVKEGFEGAMMKHINHLYKAGKRTNDIVKIKPRKTADLVVGVEIEGEGKYEGLIGSLELLDRDGFQAGFVGSGLTDSDRSKWHGFIGKVVEVEYEQFQDALIQPVFKRVRNDKNPEDSDRISDL